MLKLPNVVGLVVCDQAVIEENTRNITLVNTFNRLRCGEFPSPPQRLVIFATLTDGLGSAMMWVKVARLDSLEDIYEYGWRMEFSDPLRNMRLIVRPSGIVFPVPGRYQLALFADREWIAQTVFDVLV